MSSGESSIIVAFRALVMLACLIVVPLAAMFGSAFPELVRSTLIEPIFGPQCTPTAAAGPPKDALAAAPNFGGDSPAKNGSSATTNAGTAPAWPMASAPAQTTGTDADMASAMPSRAVIPADYPAPLGADAAGAQAGSQVGFDAPLAATNAASPQASLTSGNAAAPPASDAFGRIEKRLRECGASYYLLETWGNDGELYRFHCKMSVANHPGATRHFEATSRVALQAMTQVLEQVEAWQAGPPR